MGDALLSSAALTVITHLLWCVSRLESRLSVAAAVFVRKGGARRGRFRSQMSW